MKSPLLLMISLMNTASNPAIKCHLLPQSFLLTEGLLNPSYPQLLSVSDTICAPCQRGQQPTSACPGSSLLPRRGLCGSLSQEQGAGAPSHTQLLQHLEGSTWDKTPDHPPELGAGAIHPEPKGLFRLVATISRKVLHPSKSRRSPVAIRL